MKFTRGSLNNTYHINTCSTMSVTEFTKTLKALQEEARADPAKMRALRRFCKGVVEEKVDSAKTHKYREYMSEEIPSIRAVAPGIGNKEAFKLAARGWKKDKQSR